MNESFDYRDASTFAVMRNSDKNVLSRGLVTEASEVVRGVFPIIEGLAVLVPAGGIEDGLIVV